MAHQHDDRVAVRMIEVAELTIIVYGILWVVRELCRS